MQSKGAIRFVAILLALACVWQLSFSLGSSIYARKADKAADMLNVPVYGGDCVVSEDGSIRIIDFNDWPSFAPCRDEAAFYIATKMIQE